MQELSQATIQNGIDGVLKKPLGYLALLVIKRDQRLLLITRRAKGVSEYSILTVHWISRSMSVFRP